MGEWALQQTLLSSVSVGPWVQLMPERLKVNPDGLLPSIRTCPYNFDTEIKETLGALLCPLLGISFVNLVCLPHTTQCCHSNMVPYSSLPLKTGKDESSAEEGGEEDEDIPQLVPIQTPSKKAKLEVRSSQL